MAAVEFIKDLCTPALIIDLDKMTRNAEGMLERFHKLGVQLRPHMKTHKTLWDATLNNTNPRKYWLQDTFINTLITLDTCFEQFY